MSHAITLISSKWVCSRGTWEQIISLVQKAWQGIFFGSPLFIFCVFGWGLYMGAAIRFFIFWGLILRAGGKVVWRSSRRTLIPSTFHRASYSHTLYWLGDGQGGQKWNVPFVCFPDLHMHIAPTATFFTSSLQVSKHVLSKSLTYSPPV